MKKNIINIIAGLSTVLCLSCNNDEWSFPDFDYSTVYFAYQSPLRTIVLGDDIYDTSMDNEGKFTIMATMGGVYENNQNIELEYMVDESLCEDLKFSNGEDVVAMPSSHYIIPEVRDMVIPSGQMMGGVEVQLTDAFFDDPRSIQSTFVIPLRIISASNVDSVLSGQSFLEAPDPRIASDWLDQPKDFTLYGVKYINPWHGNYLRRGQEAVEDKNGGGPDRTIVYRASFVEWDQLCTATTLARNQVSIGLNANGENNTDLPFEMVLSFDDSGNCTVSNPEAAPYGISGSGQFVRNGDSWGNEERNVLHLQYTVDFENTLHTLTDTLVVRDRNVKFETFGYTVDRE